MAEKGRLNDMATGNLVGKKWLFVAAAFGVAQALVAAVQKVEITSANAYAYSAENPLMWTRARRSR